MSAKGVAPSVVLSGDTEGAGVGRPGGCDATELGRDVRGAVVLRFRGENCGVGASEAVTLCSLLRMIVDSA